jgi:hypothetical protein
VIVWDLDLFVTLLSAKHHKVRTSVHFRRPKTLRVRRKPKFPKRAAFPIKFQNDYDILRCPVNTEAAMRTIENLNTLVFVVDAKATKPMIKKAFERLYKVKCRKVNTLITYALLLSLLHSVLFTPSHLMTTFLFIFSFDMIQATWGEEGFYPPSSRARSTGHSEQDRDGLSNHTLSAFYLVITSRHSIRFFTRQSPRLPICF